MWTTHYGDYDHLARVKECRPLALPVASLCYGSRVLAV